MVDFIVVSNNLTAVNIIKSIKPNVYCKGMDYKDQINFDKNLNLEINALKSYENCTKMEKIDMFIKCLYCPLKCFLTNTKESRK